MSNNRPNEPFLVDDRTIPDLNVRGLKDFNDTVGEEHIKARSGGFIRRGYMWREFELVRELPTASGEADIYVVTRNGQPYVLKFYRKGFEPKISVLERVRGLSQRYREHLIEIYEYGFDNETGRWYELQEYAEHGNLKDLSEKRRLTERELQKIIDKINEGLHVLHSNGIIHRDVKPSNILVRNLEPLDVVLTDFGISSLLEGDASKKFTTLKGTFAYSAPESFTGILGKEADYWSFGMILYELLTGKHPFSSMSYQTVVYTLTFNELEIPKVGERFEELLRGLLTKNPKARWGYTEVKKWLAGEKIVPSVAKPVGQKGDLKGDQRSVREEKGTVGTSETRENAYKFMGRNYYDLKSLLRAFVQDAQSFEMAKRHIMKGYLRKWLEGFGDYDEVSWLDEIVESSKDAEEMVIRCVYRHHRDLPLALYGRIIDVDYLVQLLKEASTNELGEFENKIFKMIRSGRFQELLSIYSTLTMTDARSIQNLLSNFAAFEKAGRLSYFVKLLANYEETLHEGDGQRLRTYVDPLKKGKLEELAQLDEKALDVIVRLKYSDDVVFIGNQQLMPLRLQEEFLERINTKRNASENNDALKPSILEITKLKEVMKAVSEINPRLHLEISSLREAICMMESTALSHEARSRNMELRRLLGLEGQRSKVYIFANSEHDLINIPQTGEHYQIEKFDTTNSLKLLFVDSVDEIREVANQLFEKPEQPVYVLLELRETNIDRARTLLKYANVFYFDPTNSEFLKLFIDSIAQVYSIKVGLKERLAAIEEAFREYTSELSEITSSVELFKQRFDFKRFVDEFLDNLKSSAVNTLESESEIENTLNFSIASSIQNLIKFINPKEKLCKEFEFINNVSRTLAPEISAQFAEVETSFNRIGKAVSQKLTDDLLASDTIRENLRAIFRNEKSRQKLRALKMRMSLVGFLNVACSILISPPVVALSVAGLGLFIIFASLFKKFSEDQVNEFRYANIGKRAEPIVHSLEKRFERAFSLLLEEVRKFRNVVESNFGGIFEILKSKYHELGVY